MLRSSFRMAVNASIVAVVVGVAWLAFIQASDSEAAHVNETFSLVNHQAEEVGDTLEGTGAFIDAELTVHPSQMRDISALIDVWSPKHQKAETAYRKFDAAITAAEDSADAYFAAQRTLTERIQDQELGALARAEDDAEFSQYERWQDRAHGIRANALQIIESLRDMDASLQKLKLRSDFSFDGLQLNAIPSDIIALEQELSQFRIASDAIRNTIGSPFDAQDE